VLEENLLTREILMLAAEKSDLSSLGISTVDAFKIQSWARRAAKKEEEEARRAARDEKFSRSKRVSVYFSKAKSFLVVNFLGQSDFQAFLNAWRACGISPVPTGDILLDAADERSSSLMYVTKIEELVNGTRYFFVNPTTHNDEDVSVLRDELVRSIKAKADFNTAELLSRHLGKTVIFRANEVTLTDNNTNNSLGDLDSLFSSDDGTIVIILERKGTLSMESLDSLVSQVQRTLKAFSQCAARQDPSLTAHLGHIDINRTRVISAVYCTAGPTEAFKRLQQEGIFVIKDSVDLVELLEPQQST
jgi:hypothetical protein